jgi:hypothetical protein
MITEGGVDRGHVWQAGRSAWLLDCREVERLPNPKPARKKRARKGSSSIRRASRLSS